MSVPINRWYVDNDALVLGKQDFKRFPAISDETGKIDARHSSFEYIRLLRAIRQSISFLGLPKKAHLTPSRMRWYYSRISTVLVEAFR